MLLDEFQNIDKWEKVINSFRLKVQEEKIYYQVSTTLKEEKTFQREIYPFELIKDHHKKILLTMDNVIDNNYNGIIIQNILDFLVSN
ncbi:MAG: hypothetical protein Q7K48_00505 [Fusobacterium sp. JB021]|nr:hypothetical protein [Fusobacterium sp. JB021]MDP0507213.1 hypothetical protein [Fusobacterium sp. JB019]